MPIVISDKTSEIEPLSNLLLNKTSELYSQNNKFTKYLQSQFNIENLSKKLQKWHELEFADFIKERNKAIKKENKQLVATQQGDASPREIAFKTFDLII